MKISGKSAADILLHFSPIILLLSLCFYLLITPVNQKTSPVENEKDLKNKTEKKQVTGTSSTRLAEMPFPCFIL
jgi:hypothetical protein